LQLQHGQRLAVGAHFHDDSAGTEMQSGKRDVGMHSTQIDIYVNGAAHKTPDKHMQRVEYAPN
jgi:hypothetical protein